MSTSVFPTVNSELLTLAKWSVLKEKQAQPPGAMPGAMPAPPPDPSQAAGAAPPPGQPGMPGQQMGPVTGQPLPGMMPQTAQDPNQMAAAGGMAGAQKPKKLDPALLDQRLYSVQIQLTAIMNHLGIELPPEAIVMPPAGSPPLTPDAALPGMGGPADAVQPGGGPAGAAPGGAPGGAPPPDAAAAGGGMPPAVPGKTASDEHPWYVGTPVSHIGHSMPLPPQLRNRTAATAEIIRQRVKQGQVQGAR
jgi:hypothetical protein